MNEKAHIDADIVKLIFLKYNMYVLPLIAIVVSWFLFFQFVIPQVQSFLAIKDEVTANEQTLATLTQNYNTLALLNTNDLQQNTSTALRALPQVKDFAGILNAISDAAGLSGVTVNDYSFQIGDINSTTHTGLVNQEVQLSLTLKGNIDQTKKFLSALAQQLPLSEVISVSMSDSTTTAITANFFYETLSQPNFVDTNPLPVLSTMQKKLLQDLAKNSADVVITPTPQLSQAPIGSASSR